MALVIWNGNGEIVANNIIIGVGDPLGFDKRTKNLVMEHNLISPRSQFQSAQDFGGEPAFVSSGQGVFWLGKDSAAIGKANPQFASETDFWGRPVDRNKPLDVGAFAFDSRLLEPATRAGWYFGWAYGYSPKRQPPEEANDMPDLWTLPPVTSVPK